MFFELSWCVVFAMAINSTNKIRWERIPMSISKLRSAAIAATVLSATAIMPVTSYAELAGNIGVTSNYVWRGISQNQDEAAVSGGLDFSHESGFYLGNWVSNLSDGSYEWDVYGGYASTYNEFGYDIGLINYAYPNDDDADFLELGLKGTYQMFTVGLNYTLSSDDDNTATFSDGDYYIYASAEFEVKPGLILAVLIGNYSFDVDDRFDYTNFQVSLSKDDFTFAIEKNDADESDSLGGIWGDDVDEVKVVVSWSKSFNLM